MNAVSVFLVIFSIIGAADLIFGNRLDLVYQSFHIDPSIVPAIFFSNDMGGAVLASEVAQDEMFGMFNGLVVASMMGCTMSFSIPVVLNMVKKELHQYVLLGLLCGIVTVSIGCFVSGLIAHIPMAQLLYNILPLFLFSIVIACGLLFLPDLCIKLLGGFGEIIRILIVIGLVLGIISFMTGTEAVKGLGSFEGAALICFNAAVAMSGAFPFVKLVSKVVAGPMRKLSEKLEIEEKSSNGFVSTLVSSITTFEAMNEMDPKGIVLNAAFAVAAGFTLADHLAFTLLWNDTYVFAVIAGKLVGGISALILASWMYRRVKISKYR